jgi:hypothetical protein
MDPARSVGYHQRARHLDHDARRPRRDGRDQVVRSATTRYKLMVSSTKSMTGHLLGAAGVRRGAVLGDGDP